MATKVNKRNELNLNESTPSDNKSSLRFPDLSDRNTDEIVFAFVGPIGAGVTTIASILRKIMIEKFHYTVNEIKMSSLIKEHLETLAQPEKLNEDQSDQFKRIRTYQHNGNNIRSKNGSDFLSVLCVEAIRHDRENDPESFQESENNNKIALSRRRVHIIDSLKNPQEYELLKSVYGDAIWLFGVLAPYEKRRARLKNIGIKSSEIDSLIEIDEHEKPSYGQRVRKTFEYADFFIRNDGDIIGNLRGPCERFCDLIMDNGVITPSFFERGMSVASTSAKSSACLSRQVGAAVYSSDKALVGIGANDVPKYKGGLYNNDSSSTDNRCFNWQGKICHNDDQKHKIAQQISGDLKGKLRDDVSVDDIIEVIENSRVKDLIEFSRAVHAEMEAIVSAARDGKGCLRGGVLFSTTEPCHNCARHIVASGIEEVIFIEPYPKSLAITLHPDSISNSESDRGKKCVFLQFEGVAPKQFYRLFSMNSERKISGKKIEGDARQKHPVAKSPLDGFAVREEIVIQKLAMSGHEVGDNDEDRDKERGSTSSIAIVQPKEK